MIFFWGSTSHFGPPIHLPGSVTLYLATLRLRSPIRSSLLSASLLRSSTRIFDRLFDFREGFSNCHRKVFVICEKFVIIGLIYHSLKREEAHDAHMVLQGIALIIVMFFPQTIQWLVNAAA
jgi:hypothetical protein